MSAAVIEVGPVTVRGPGPVCADLASVAVANIDDGIALVDDEPVDVSDVWAEVLDAVSAGARNLVLVCPTWWTADRRDRIRAVASASGAEVVVLSRVQALGAPTCASRVVVEIADDVIMVSGADAESVTLARRAGADVSPEQVVRAVIAMAGESAEVIVDPGFGVAGASALSRAVVAGLRRRGLTAVPAEADTWPGASPTTGAAAFEGGARARPGRIGLPVAAAVTVVLGGLAFAGPGHSPPDPVMTVLVEGRVGMQIPAQWAVHRVTEGPGSARVQVVSPDPRVMIHLTQSGVGDGRLAETLRRALKEQPSGVFVDFDPAAVVAARPAVSYREVRNGREIRWAVFADGGVRIAIGCQSAPGLAEVIRAACDAAIRSAHAVS